MMFINQIKDVETIYPFRGNFAPFNTADEEIGIINRHGEVLLYPSDYKCDHLKDYSMEGLFIFNKNGEKSVFNANTQRYFTSKLLTDICGKYYSFEESGKVGLCDKNFNTVVTPIYDSLSIWQERILAQKDGKFGIIDFSENVICPFLYDCEYTNLFDNSLNYRVFSQDGYSFWIDINGKRISRNSYDYLECRTSKGYGLAKIDGKICVIDETENVMCITKYTTFYDSYLNNLFWCGPEHLAFLSNKLYGIMDIHGTVVVAPQYALLHGNPYSDIIIAKSDHKCGAIYPYGTVAIPFKYDRLYHLKNDNFVRALRGDKWGVIDLKGNTIIPFKYDEVCLYGGLSEIPVKKNGVFYYINEKNEYLDIIPKHIRDYPNLKYIFGYNGKYAKFNADGKKGLIDRNGTVVLEAKYKMIVKCLEPDVFLVAGPGCFKHVNVVTGQELQQYDMQQFPNGAIRFTKDHLEGLKIDGKVILPPLYKTIEADSNTNCSFYLVQENSESAKYAIFNLEGKQVTGFIYDHLNKLEEGSVLTMPGFGASVSVDGESFIVDAEGKPLTKSYYDITPFTADGYSMCVDKRINMIDILRKHENGIIMSCGSANYSDFWDKESTNLCKRIKWITTNRIAFKENELWGLMKPEGGQILLPAQYKSIYVEDDSHFIIVDKFGYCSCIDSNCIILVPGIYRSLAYYPKYHCYIAKKENGKFGVLAEDASTLIPFEYDHLAISASDGLDLISVLKDGQHFFMDASQNKIELF